MRRVGPTASQGKQLQLASQVSLPKTAAERDKPFVPYTSDAPTATSNNDVIPMVTGSHWLKTRLDSEAYLVTEVITGGARSPEQIRTFLRLSNDVENWSIHDR